MRLPLITFLQQRCLTLLIGVYGAAYAIALSFSQTFLFGYDAMVGLLIANATQRHHVFNTLFFPAINDLEREQSVFVTWWTPGQYIFQLGAKTLCNIPYEISTKWLVWICLVGGLAGYTILFRRLGLTPRTTFWVVSYSGLYAFSTGMVDAYTGGDTLLWAYAPWFLSLALIGRPNLGHGVVLIAAAFLGFFLKAAFIPIALIGFLLRARRQLADVEIEASNVPPRAWLKPGLILAISTGIFLMGIRYLFLSFGPGIDSVIRHAGLAARQFIFPLVAPFISAAQMPFINRTAEWLAILPFVVYILIKQIYTSIARRDYRFLVLTTTAVYFIFFSMLYYSGAGVSYELRHFRLPAMLWISVFFVWLSSAHGVRRICGIAFLAIATVLGVTGTWNSYRREIAAGPVDSSTPGLLAGYDSTSLTKLKHIDNSETGLTLFLHPSLMRLALALEHNDYFIFDNFICYQFNDAQMKAEFLRHRRPRMALLVPSDYDQVRDPDRIFSRFADVPSWTFVQQTRDFALYRTQDVGPKEGELHR